MDADEPDPRLLALLADYPPGLFDRTLYRSLEWVHRYTLARVTDIMHRLACSDALGRGVEAEGLALDLACTPRFLAPLRWLLAFAASEGVLTSEPGDAVGREPAAPRYRLSGTLPAADIARLRAEGLDIDAENARTLALLDAAADAFPEIARGALSGEEALLSPAGLALWLDYFHNDNRLYAVINRLAALAAADHLARFAGSRGDARPGLSVLELGAGAGSGSDALLSALGATPACPPLADVLITEPNALFRRRAERGLRARYPAIALRFASLDIDRDWAEQGIEPGSVDLIFAVNVLHVARDLHRALTRLRESLVPGGLLVLGECIRPSPGQPVYIELVFSMLSSFTEVETDPRLRPTPGFLAAEDWQAVLAGAGFSGVAISPDPQRIRPLYARLSAAAICARG